MRALQGSSHDWEERRPGGAPGSSTSWCLMSSTQAAACSLVQSARDKHVIIQGLPQAYRPRDGRAGTSWRQVCTNIDF
jgi:hypothetical protein